MLAARDLLTRNGHLTVAGWLLLPNARSLCSRVRSFESCAMPTTNAAQGQDDPPLGRRHPFAKARFPTNHPRRRTDRSGYQIPSRWRADDSESRPIIREMGPKAWLTPLHRSYWQAIAFDSIESNRDPTAVFPGLDPAKPLTISRYARNPLSGSAPTLVSRENSAKGRTHIQ